MYLELLTSRCDFILASCGQGRCAVSTPGANWETADFDGCSMAPRVKDMKPECKELPLKDARAVRTYHL